MAVRVEITDEGLLTNLMTAFRRCGCRVDRTAADACRVTHPFATSADEALLEVAFFVRAWQLGYPHVGTTIAA
jgi:hypothetical protein